MGWFTKKDSSESARDPELPLSIAGAQRLRQLVRDAWAEHGREVTVHSDHVVDAEGSAFGLWNLAVLVSDAPQRKWPGLVRTHVGMLATPKPGVETLTEDELRAQLVLRLADGGGVPNPEWFETAPTLVGDLRLTLALDFPDTVLTPPESDLAARGDLTEWRAVGRANLWHMMRSEKREHQVLSRGNGDQFDVLLGESFFTASMVLFLPELLELAGRADLGRGVLVAMPYRHQIAFRVIDGPNAALSLQSLFLFAMAGFDDGAGPLSPHVYWVKDGRWEQVTGRDAEGAHMIVSPELAEALGMSQD
ncbi:MAG: hypothetical protein CVT62_07700 [Actinobacteria bacterium HGW-Actinobacteria-2]|nr:MAG: hypothetical protein CVT62_07700 [Actinobacteria bacterium HGW-Actinobacteria-2]